MENKQFYYILFRLFWDDKPVGFENWSFESGWSYTYGEPNRQNGHVGYGWNGVKIPHNRKEILDIKYVDREYLKNKKNFGDAMKGIFDSIKANKDVINQIRESNKIEPIFTE